MIVELIERFAKRFCASWKRFHGCEADGGTDAYLTRYVMAETRWGSIYIHVFERSDRDDGLHDHPWDFTAILLWPGYIEVTPNEGCIRDGEWRCQHEWTPRRSRKWPGMVLRRRATWRHRVELLTYRVEDEPGCCWEDRPRRHASIVFVKGGERRKWGFIGDNGIWTYWRTAMEKKQCL